MQVQIQAQKLQFSVRPQQIQLLELFHLSTNDLHARIQDELSSNPLLEENITADDIDKDETKDEVQDFQDQDEYQYDDVPDYKLEHHNCLSDANFPQRPLPEHIDFRKDLTEQIGFISLSTEDLEMVHYLIGSLDESGMLGQTLTSLTDDYSFKKCRTIKEVDMERVRQMILRLEPVGIGCLNSKEFLLLQLMALSAKGIDTRKAVQFLEVNHSNSAHLAKIGASIGMDANELQLVLRLIRTCKSKPITITDSTRSHSTLVPDFIVHLEAGKIEVSLYHQRSATLFVRKSPSMGVPGKTEHDKYLIGKLSAAQWFVDAIKQREATMKKVMEVIIGLQRDYFINGEIELLRPMILRNVADGAGVDVSTVSRITCNKYADTHFGMIHLKSLFSEGIDNEWGEKVSNKVIQSSLAETVKNEDGKNPLTDQQLVRILSLKGVNIARRTVAKYRRQLKIPAAQLRASASSELHFD